MDEVVWLSEFGDIIAPLPAPLPPRSADNDTSAQDHIESADKHEKGKKEQGPAAS